MSGDLYTKPGTVNKVYYEQEDKENMVNIYVSAESLRVYDNPWQDDMSPNTPETADTQQPVVLENSRKRTHVRSFSVFLCAVCLLLLAGIICLGVHREKDRADCSRKVCQILEDIANLKNISEQTGNTTELSREIHNLWNKFGDKKSMKCENLDYLP
ncbi:hypothetical protein PBY51_020112 [Eleginops maclovinus]|uniref:Uncharacterized protein n=1 Tax=Eleginops maclovinus TaxID=56733 RepID=A0AAN7XSB6_ELEMC|nr:hypothetical protein PBY51_020112 [Eleginops maclovinus]